MLVSISIVKNKGMEFLHGQMAASTKGNGSMDSRTEKEHFWVLTNHLLAFGEMER